MRSKILTSEEAVNLIKSGDTLAVQGFVGFSHPEELSVMLEKKFVATGQPSDLTVIYAAGQGDGKEKCINRYAQEGMVKRVIGGHYNLAPKIGKLISANKIEAYNLPQGVILHLFRAMAGGKPGVITHVGLKTFADPRVEGGKLNSKTTEDIVEVVTFKGKEYLHYQPVKIDVAFIRGTTADEDGNITMEKECVLLEAFHIAQATKRYGGKVIVQVERVAAKGTLHPQQVKVPGALVDAIVIAKPEYHWQTNEVAYDPSLCGEMRRPMDSLPAMEMSERKVIARRCALELVPDAVINLGIGVPDGVAVVANEEGLLEEITLTLESGPMGGVAAAGLNFGCSFNPVAILDHPNMFDFYDGGGLDIAYLGLAQADEDGNINVSKFGNRIAGCGGFVNISQNAKKVVYCGTLTAGGLEVAVENGQLRIVKEGAGRKFVKKVDQVTFSGVYARETGQTVLYVTERAVFELTAEGMVLTEIAPGVSLEKDVLAHIEFPIKVSPQLKQMDKRIFEAELMGIKPEFQGKTK
ncbi:MAG: acyl CoA:acetate/3-ketoacid CoA transferase [Negativicutes bacterium]|nr:acyl CoA:acetate/3-ketoacid CoA transferase [Negativicutes bacterium]